ncbi:MAG: protein-methionine-sulfoxide reductase heme-binding subunit MsrQ [Amphritea sp.]
MVLARKTAFKKVFSFSRWWLVFLLPLIPLGLIFWDGFNDNLGADPGKYIVDELGTWALNMLWITLAISPTRFMFNWRQPLRYRRMLGLYALFYAVLHLLAFATFLVGWRGDLLLRELTQRPYIIVGFAALLLLLPLGVTSTQGGKRRLGRNWKRLHQLIYPISLLVMLHFIWQIRASFKEQLIYGLILAWMLGYRLYQKRKSNMT